jgi:hypothetical protein
MNIELRAIETYWWEENERMDDLFRRPKGDLKTLPTSCEEVLVDLEILQVGRAT